MIDPHAASTLPPEPAKSPGTGPYNAQDTAAALVRLLDQYLADLQAGRAPDRAKLLADHPELASQLEQCLAGIEFVHQASKPASETPTQLGDFRILREIGRGGMGVVYEAEHVQLKRKVALTIIAEPAGRPARARSSIGRCSRPPARGLSRSHHPAQS